ncbi:MAG: NAD(P)/FAD-dependent oxidoreductase [Flavobacteriaceae bacterium]|nr:NAD(P)/FAD-dependent oxidoreductase [Flavobacteriaceae bacterium]
MPGENHKSPTTLKATDKIRESDTFFDLLIIGGGAAGFFAAAHLKQLAPQKSVCILEKQKDVLSKVKISGGGRCNVTHACFDPKKLVGFYPRGHKELLGPFYKFGPRQTIDWFEKKDVLLKTEADGRMFPVSNKSQSIIDCLIHHSLGKGVSLFTSCHVQSVRREDTHWLVKTHDNTYRAKNLMIATGSSPKSWAMIETLGHKIEPPVPSLFTFNTTDTLVQDMAGISIDVRLQIKKSNHESFGPLLITHWGLSGPAILKLSAFGARWMANEQYKFELTINWLQTQNTEEAVDSLHRMKAQHPKQFVANTAPETIPKRFWAKLLQKSEVEGQQTWAATDKKSLRRLAETLTQTTVAIDGKSTFKEEFVTAGGVQLKEIDFKNYSSKLHPHLYFGGEVLNIDAVTGGFNFQNAWTSGFLIAEHLAV